MNVDADIARRLAATHDIHAEVEHVAYLVSIAGQPRQADGRRMGVLLGAVADLTEQLACGQDFDRELSVLGACVLEWKTSRLAEIARCCCPVETVCIRSDQVPWECGLDACENGCSTKTVVDAVAECPVHGEGE